MKKLLFLLLVITPLLASAQKKEVKQKFAEYTEKGYYKIDGNNVVVSVVLDDVPGTKDEIYIKVKNFFTRTYKDANSVLQTDDKEAGTLIGKGYFKHVFAWRMLGVLNSYLNSYHILRVDIKDGKVRAICTADQWEEYNGEGRLDETVNIVDYAPVTDRRFYDKGKQMEAFVNLVDLMHGTIDQLEKIIKVGGVAVESEDW